MNMPNLENYEFLHGTASKLVQLPGAEPVILTHIEGQVITVTLSAYMNQIAFLVRMVRDDQDCTVTALSSGRRLRQARCSTCLRICFSRASPGRRESPFFQRVRGRASGGLAPSFCFPYRRLRVICDSVLCFTKR